MSDKTYIKRLKQGDQEFVPITMAEAVVVNQDGMGLPTTAITTLDNVLRTIIGKISNSGNSNPSIDTDALKEEILTDINSILAQKQDKLTKGHGIEISRNQEGELVIDVVLDTTIYKIEEELPQAGPEHIKHIYLVPSQNSQGFFEEYLCVNKDGLYDWEQLGTLSTNVDLSNYYTISEITTKVIDPINTRFVKNEKDIGEIEKNITNINSSMISASPVITKDNNGNEQTVVISYIIPDTLYASMLGINDGDYVAGN